VTVTGRGDRTDAAIPGGVAPGARVETTVGGALVGLTVLAALYFRWRPGASVVDHWGFVLVPPDRSGVWIRITELRTVPFLIGGSVVAALVVAGRDRWRALACLVAPTLAVLLAEYVLKPVIARRYAGVLTFPSGTTTVVASVAAAWALAVPRALRPPVVVVGVVVVVLECAAVVALQWHFPTDALGGAALGAGTVLLVDGLVHRAPAGARR
jgi:membrane-associated phospholipid phosphatase